MTGEERSRGVGPASTAAIAYDVIVIGAGHNGLVAANYIADAGHDVLVLEAGPQIGGMTSSGRTFERAPEHVAVNYSFDPFFWDSFPPSKELELEERHGWKRIRVDPGLVYLDPGEASIAFWEDPAETAAEIRKFSERDSRAYLEFAELLRAFSDVALAFGIADPTRFDAKPLARTARFAVKHRRRLREVLALAMGSARDAIADRFEHPIVCDALHAVAGSTVPNSNDGSGAGFLWLANQHRHSHRHPVGGIQSLPEALARRLAVAGGRIETNARVESVLVDGGHARGVMLADGRERQARKAVMAACDPHTALTRLVPDGVLPPELERRAQNIAHRNNNYGQMKVDLAFSGQLALTRHAKWRGDDVDLRRPMHVLGTAEGVGRAFARSAAGLLPYEDDWSMWNCIGTGTDPSQAPAGQDNFYCYLATAPVEADGGWTYALRDDAGQSVVNKLAKFYDGVAELELDRRVMTNQDMATRANAASGNVTHVDMVPSRAGAWRPARGLAGYRTPIDGLMVTGAGHHPGGGITGAPGYMAAREFLRTAGA